MQDLLSSRSNAASSLAAAAAASTRGIDAARGGRGGLPPLLQQGGDLPAPPGRIRYGSFAGVAAAQPPPAEGKQDDPGHEETLQNLLARYYAGQPPG